MVEISTLSGRLTRAGSSKLRQRRRRSALRLCRLAPQRRITPCLRRDPDDPPELRPVLTIDHPAAVRAGELLAMGRIAEAEAVLEGVLCILAGPPTDTRLTWFSGHHLPGGAQVGCLVAERPSDHPDRGLTVVGIGSTVS